MRMILWVLSIGGALGSACGLYQLEHEVKTMERSLARLDDSMRRDNEAIQVLQAEWSYLNRPERLQELVGRHLTLTPSGLKQIVAAPSALAALPAAVVREAGPMADEAIVPAVSIPLPEPKPAPPRRVVAPTPPEIVAPLPAPRTVPVAAVAVPAAFRLEDIRIGATR